MTLIGNGSVIYDSTAAWANNDAQNTAVTVDIPRPPTLQFDADYGLVVTNPSAETDITVEVRSKETFGGQARYPQIGETITVPKSTPDGVQKPIPHAFLGEGLRLVFKNATAVGAAGAFTANVRIRKV